MKICFFADCNHPNTLNWARYLSVELGHDVHLLSFNKPITNENSLTIHSIERKRFGKLGFLMMTSEFRHKVRDLHPDILIGYRLTSYAYLAARVGFHPLVVAAQSQKAGAWIWGLRKPAQGLAARYAVKAADLVLAWGKHMEDDVVSLGGKREKILTTPRGVNLELFPFKSRANYDSEFVLITTRSLVKPYGLDLAIKAVAKLQDRIPGIRLRLVGDGPYRQKLEALARKLSVDSLVEFKGKIPYDELHHELDSAHLYLSTVPEDGVSSSLLEAMASGLPLIVPDIGANRIWSQYGCELGLFIPSSLQSLSNSILKCYARYEMDTSVLLANRKMVEQRANWKTNMRIIEAELLNLVKGKKNR